VAPTSRTEGAGHVARLRRRGFWLEYASMAWMTAEAAIAITAGVLASSLALTGFGLDSVIEFFAAAVVVWQLRGEGEGQDRETRAVRLIGVTFFALAAYLTVEGIRDLAGHARPEQSIAGLAVAAAALVVMPLLAVAKRRTGRALGNQTLIADSAESALCALTSAAALLGVGLNAWLGWWWADPAAGLVIAALAVREGLEAWEDTD
jgi:divalent metal cation (Fe/Co/Zn/Cd) transporter